MSTVEALTASLHLACVRGPDQGMIVPLTEGTVIGRQGIVPLCDPTVSRRHCEVRGGRLVDLNPTNASRRVGIRSPGDDLSLRRRARFLLGRGLWVVRSRPVDLTWPHPPQPGGRSGTFTLLRLLPLVFVGFALWRFLPSMRAFLLPGAAGVAVIVVGIMILRRLLRARRHDGSHLLMVLLARHSAQQNSQPGRSPAGSSSEVRVWLRHVGGHQVSVGPQHILGLIGPQAYAHAQWVAAQVLLLRPDLTLYDDQQTNHPRDDSALLWLHSSASDALPSGNGNLQIAWAPTISELPPEVNRIVTATHLVADTWLCALTVSDPGTVAAPTIQLPDTVTFEDLGIALDAPAQRQRWANFSAVPTKRLSPWAVPIGIRAAEELEPVMIDLPTMGPHALMAGGTGSGKSVALRTWLAALAAFIPPTALRMVLIDYKGGAGLGDLQNLPHVEQFHTDLEPSGTAWLLGRLRQILQQRKLLLFESGFRDITQWETQASTVSSPQVGPPPRLLVVIDEFQALSEEHPHFLSSLSRLASQGRSLGLHLILATQRPGPAVSADLRGTIDLRIALRCTEKADSLAIIGDTQAADLPRIPGRAIVEEKEIQFAYLADPGQLQCLSVAALDLPVSSATPIWPAPLPLSLHASDLAAETHAHAAPSIRLGLFEPLSAVPEPLSELNWSGKPLLLAGPHACRQELTEQALSLALRWAEATERPVHLFAPAIPPNYRAADHAPWTTALTVDDGGEIAALLSGILSAGPSIVVAIEIAAALSHLDARGIGIESTALWHRLVHNAETRGITLIVTDTEGASKSDRLAQRLLRVPDESALVTPALLRLLPPLPSLGMGSPAQSVRALSKEEVLSPTPGRFLAMGFPAGDGPVLAQIVEPEPDAGRSVRPRTDGFHVRSWSVAPDLGSGLYGGPSLVPFELPANGTVLVGGSASHAQILQQALRTDTPDQQVTIEHCPSDQWLNAVMKPHTTIMAIEPPLEMIRYCAQRHPDDAAWLRGHYPYPPNTGIGLWNKTIRRIYVLNREKRPEFSPQSRRLDPGLY